MLSSVEHGKRYRKKHRGQDREPGQMFCLQSPNFFPVRNDLFKAYTHLPNQILQSINSLYCVMKKRDLFPMYETVRK